MNFRGVWIYHLWVMNLVTGKTSARVSLTYLAQASSLLSRDEHDPSKRWWQPPCGSAFWAGQRLQRGLRYCGDWNLSSLGKGWRWDSLLSTTKRCSSQSHTCKFSTPLFWNLGSHGPFILHTIRYGQLRQWVRMSRHQEERLFKQSMLKIWWNWFLNPETRDRAVCL